MGGTIRNKPNFVDRIFRVCAIAAPLSPLPPYRCSSETSEVLTRWYLELSLLGRERAFHPSQARTGESDLSPPTQNRTGGTPFFPVDVGQQQVASVEQILSILA